MTLMTKQTTGLGVTILIPLICGLIPARKKDWNLAATGVAAFAGGWLIPHAVQPWSCGFPIITRCRSSVDEVRFTLRTLQ